MSDMNWEKIQDLTLDVLSGGITGLISLVVILSALAAVYYKYKDKLKQLMIEKNKRRSYGAQARNATDNAKAEEDQVDAENALKRLLTKLNWQQRIQGNQKKDRK